MRLVYRGKGSWLPGYPARDIDEDEVAEYTDAQLYDLMACGLYDVIDDEPDDHCDDALDDIPIVYGYMGTVELDEGADPDIEQEE